MNFLSEIEGFSKSNLKKIKTKISYPNGKQFIRSSDDEEEKEIKFDDAEQSAMDSSSIYWSRFSGFLVDLVPDYSIDEIIPGLYLSGDDVATNIDILKSKNVRYILNLTTNVPNKFEKEIIYKKIVIYDFESQKIDNYFRETFEFIDEALKIGSNSVLVHCNAGISRSSSFVIAYLMMKGIFTDYQSSFNHVKSKRSKIRPNSGFVTQLLDLENELKKI